MLQPAPDDRSSPDLPAEPAAPDEGDLQQLLTQARLSETGLHAFFDATAPRLCHALSDTRGRGTVDDVLVATYRHVWDGDRGSPAGGDVWAWLTRIAVVELALARPARRHDPSRASRLAGGPLGSRRIESALSVLLGRGARRAPGPG